jgi:PAS domain S-box-containing protein
LDGAKRWLKSQGRVICDHQDQPSRILGVIWDVTESKQAQLREQEATRRLDMLVTESPAVVFTYEMEPELHLNFISRNVETILGWKPEEFTTDMGLWAQCIHPEDIPSIDEGKRLLAETGKHVFEYRFKDSQGKYHWIHDEQRIINGEGRQKAVVGAWWDITETKAALAELTLLKAAIEQAAEIVLITDAKADIVYVNPAFEKITGYSPQEALGNNPRILKSGEQDNSFYQTLWGQLVAGMTWRGRFVNKRKDGHFYTEEASISPVRDASGHVVNYVAVKRDISRELELEKQFLDAQKMEAIGTLAGGVAHDFNNILAIILANAEMLEFSEELGSESRFTLNQIITASKRARELVRQILAFSRRGRQDKILMNLRPIVRETMGLLRSSLPSFIRIETYFGDDTGMIFADPTQMHQVIMNLCTNAGHAMEQKGGLLRIALANTTIAEKSSLLEPDFPPGDYVQLTVSDTGHGMPLWLLKKIFEPYFTTKEPGKGTGLGLPVAYGIVKSHGGTIKVSSGAGSGSIFEVYLPRAKDEALEPEKSEMPLATGTGKVLFVDDEPSLTLVVHKMIRRLGYEVQTAHSPIGALELFRSDPKAFDLVITDMAMPEMTGTNLAKALLDIRPDLPVILSTGYSDQVNEEMLEKLGIKALLMKPITSQELAHAIRMALIR